MKKGLKILISTIIGLTSSIVLIMSSFAMGLAIGIPTSFLFHYKGTNVEYNWSETDTFSKENVVTIEKKKDKDFVILNLADVQMCDLEDLGKHSRIIHKEITYLVNEIKPDLITLTGDQTWSNENLISLKLLISWLDSYKIPYAPVFGNHDFGNGDNNAVASRNFCCDLYERGKYSLFKRGPSNIGTLGNYAINIEEEGQIIKTLYMIDYGVEEEISPSQIAYFDWIAEGNKSLNGGEYTSSMMFMHRPMYEHFMVDHCVSDIVVDFKDKGLTNVVCGHEHEFNYTRNVEGIDFTFACKTGELAFYYDNGIENRNGGTYFTLNGSNVSITDFHVESDQFHIEGSDNWAK